MSPTRVLDDGAAPESEMAGSEMAGSEMAGSEMAGSEMADVSQLDNEVEPPEIEPPGEQGPEPSASSARPDENAAEAPEHVTRAHAKAEAKADALAKKTSAVERKVAKKAEAVAGKRAHVVARNEARRQLNDPVVMRALAHPLRVALLDALLREGPLTATAASVILDDSPGNMSWHLNVLAKYGFVEEAEGGRGRSRPWRLVNLGTSFEDEPDNPELSVAGEAFTRVVHERNFARVEQFLNERKSFPPEWRSAAFSSSTITYLTPEEMNEFGDEITDLLSRYRDRAFDVDKRPEGSKAVAIVAFGHPLRPTPSGN